MIIHRMERVCFLFMFFLLIFQMLYLSVKGKAKSHYDISKRNRNLLVDTFKKEGFNKGYLEKVFFDKRLDLLPQITSLILVRKANNNDQYKDLLQKKPINQAWKFSRYWRTRLRLAGKKYKVDQDVIVAIFLIESYFGQYKGNNQVISVFSTIFQNSQEPFKSKIIEQLGKKKKYYKKRIEEKAEWALIELKALLQIGLKRNVDLFRIKGSYAGAFGIPQFLPSSYLKWGIDSDKNGTINLFLYPDSIESTANYFQKHGWKNYLNHKEKGHVIWKYNRSTSYVNAVLSIMKKIKEKRTHYLKSKSNLKTKFVVTKFEN